MKQHINPPVVLNGRKCGTYYMGECLLCPDCKRQAELEYPQGWVSYPGDTCPHGKHTGGIGADIICGHCEDGDIEEARKDAARRAVERLAEVYNSDLEDGNGWRGDVLYRIAEYRAFYNL